MKETLTSRERVIRAIRHEPVDRVPIDLGCHMSTGISMFAYWNLRKHLGLSTDNIWIPDMVQGLGYVDRDILERFHCDLMLLEPPYERTIRWNPRGEYRFAIAAEANPELTGSGDWIIRKNNEYMRMPAQGYFFDGGWLADWGSGTEDERLTLYAQLAERLFKETPYALNMVGYSHGVGFDDFGGGSFDDAVCACEDPDAVHAKRRRTLEKNLRRMGKIIDRFGQYIQIVSLADDMGTQQGPMCSPLYLEEFCIPYYRKFCDFVHANSDIKVFLHCCGSIKPVIPLLIEAGIDILNPVQISAANMDPRELKDQFGSRICFWGGGCDTQGVLGKSAPDEVARHVRELVRIFKPGSGFVFNQVHNIMGNVPPQNIVTMLDTVYEESFN